MTNHDRFRKFMRESHIYPYLTYDEDLKKQFRALGLRWLNEFGRRLKFDSYKASYNPGGTAVSGDLMFSGIRNGKGVYIRFNADGLVGGDGFYLIRTITHLRDYTGGHNTWLGIYASEEDIENRVEKLLA